MKQILRTMICLSALFIYSVPAVAGECWDPKEISTIEGFTELDEVVTISFKDAVDCTPVTDATVFLRLSGKGFKLATDPTGYLQLPLELFEDINDGVLACVVKKDGYIPLRVDLPVMSGTVWQRRLLLSRKLPVEKMRFVLQWDNQPSDLDLHLIKDNSIHISFRNTRFIPDLASLDRDDVNGYGPETITLDRVQSGSSYKLFVHNYSNDLPFQGKGRVYVYANNKLDRIVALPETSARKVALVEIRNKEIIYPAH